MRKIVCETATLLRRRNLENNYYSFTFGPFSKAAECRPGQFVHLRLPQSEVYFRRAMSVAAIDPENGELEIIFKIFGRGTTALSRYERGSDIGILGPLGRGFDLPAEGETAVLVAGGVGFPPLLYQAVEMIARGYAPEEIEFFYGGRSAVDILERDRIRKLGVNFHPVTDDGSLGIPGLVTEAVAEYIDHHQGEKLRLYACGPDAMLKATDDLGRAKNVPGQVSLEAPMPCGIGVCLGCVVELRAGGHARVCQEGPIFEIGEVKL